MLKEKSLPAGRAFQFEIVSNCRLLPLPGNRLQPLPRRMRNARFAQTCALDMKVRREQCAGVICATELARK